MELLEAKPQYLRTAILPWKQVTIIPIGDIQFGSPGCDIERLKAEIQRGLDQNAWFIGMGDYHDFLSPSNRRFLANSGLYDTAHDLIESWYMEHLEELKEILRPTKGRWLGMLEGHHYFELSDGGTTDTELCRFLEAPFLGTCAVLRMQFKGTNSHVIDCWLWAHHGTGGGDDPLRQLVRVAPGFPQVDVFLQGHNTSIDARPKDMVEFYGNNGNLKMRDRRQLFVATGGFMRGYQRGRPQGTYVEKAMMRPTALGSVTVYITPTRRHDYNELDIHVLT